MAWEETRGQARVSVGVTRQVAHADDAKSRVDEVPRVQMRALRPRVLAGVGAGALVLALVAAFALRGGEEKADTAAPIEPSATPSPSATAPTAAEVLEESSPSGTWRLVVTGISTTTRGGDTSPLEYRDDPVEWTFPAASCTDAQCTGSITSSSGSEFPFSWDGRNLSVQRTNTVQRGKKAACVDIVTGEVRPIEQSAARLTWTYRYGSFSGSAKRMVARSTTRTSYEFFGDCEPQPGDEVKATFKWVLTPLETT